MPVGPDGRWSLVGLPAGTHTLTLRTEDSNTGSACIPSASIQATVTVTALIVNNAPTFPPIAPISTVQGTAGSTVLPPATDADGDPITYSLT